MKTPIKYAAILGCLAVLLGAFGAHALQERLDEKALAVWATANRYHSLHALAFLVLEVGAALGLQNTKLARLFWAGGLFFFSGGLYLYAFTGLKLAALVAPIGGLSFAAGWLALLRVQLDPKS